MGNGMNYYPINFSDVPPIGHQHSYFRGTRLTLTEAAKYTKADGSEGNLLTWVSDDGRTCTSGLRSKSVTWSKPGKNGLSK